MIVYVCYDFLVTLARYVTKMNQNGWGSNNHPQGSSGGYGGSGPPNPHNSGPSSTIAMGGDSSASRRRRRDMTDQYQSTLASRFRVITMKDGIAVTDGHGAYIRDKLGPSYYSLLDRNGDQRPFSFRDLIQEHDRLNPHAPFG